LETSAEMADPKIDSGVEATSPVATASVVGPARISAKPIGRRRGQPP
jgi:hypothetical protein